MRYITLPNLVKIYNIINDDDLRIDEFNNDELIQWLINEVNNNLKTLSHNKIKTHELIDIYNLIFDDMKNENWEEIGTNEQIYDAIIESINDEVISKIDINNVTLKPIPPHEPKWIYNPESQQYEQPNRYINSDDYLFRNFNDKRMQQIRDDNELRRLRYENEQ